MTMSRSMPTTGPDQGLSNPAALIDHTLLKPQADTRQIAQLCEEAVEWGFSAVCVPPVFARQAVNVLYGSDISVASVVGFPCGYDSTRTKVQQAIELAGLGCAELDMVIHLGAALNDEFSQVEEEIAQLVLAVPECQVKVIIECCYLDERLKRELTSRVVSAGAAYVKTSTGFGSGGATLEDVRLLAAVSAGRVGVKAAGGIRSFDDLLQMYAAGATRIGTSAGVEIMRQWRDASGVS